MPRFSSAPMALAAALAWTCSACGSSSTPPPATPVAEGPAPVVDAATDAKLRAAMAAPDRLTAEVSRDKWRHPAETLGFFGLRDNMTVVELWPGGGWYASLLAPVLAEKGKLVVTNFDPKGPDGHGTQVAKAYAERLASKPNVFGKVDVHIVHPPDDLTLGPDGSADMVVTFRNVHNWAGDNVADKVMAAAFRVLKPGGVLGIVEHRAKADADPKKVGDTGYVPEAFVIDLAQRAGFHLDARSEINANPNDIKD